jgi:hypothetical protein
MTLDRFDPLMTLTRQPRETLDKDKGRGAPIEAVKTQSC